MLDFPGLSKLEPINVSTLDAENRERIVNILLKNFIVGSAVSKGLCYTYEYNAIFSPHTNFAKSKKKLHGKQVSRVFREKETPSLNELSMDQEGKINFCSHSALSIDVRTIDEKTYVFFNPLRLFTSDGKAVLSGTASTKLHHKFTRERVYNDTERRQILHLVSLLGLPLKDRRNMQIYETNLYFSSPIVLTIPVSCEEGRFVTPEELTVLNEFFEDELHGV